MTSKQQNPSLPQAQLAAVARPVDTFVAPAQTWRGEGQGLMDAAKALQELNPKLQAWFKEEKQQQDQAYEDYGENLNTNRVSFNDHMKALEKSDPEKFEQLKGMNPHVERGFNKAFLEGKAMSYGMALSTDLANDPMITEVDNASGAERQISVFEAKDPAAIQTWLGSHKSKWLEENGLKDMDPSLMREHFNPKVSAMEGQVVTKRAAEWKNQFYDKLGDQTQQNSIDGLTSMYDGANLTDPQDRDATARAAGVFISRQIENARSHGFVETDKLHTAIIKAVTSFAEDRQEPAILDALKHIETSKGSYLGKTGAGAAAIAQSSYNIEKRKHTEEEWDWTKLQHRWALEDRPWALQQRDWAKAEHDRKMQVEGHEDSVKDLANILRPQMISDPTKNWLDDSEFRKLANKDDKMATELLRYTETWVGHREAAKADDPNNRSQLFYDVNTDPSNFDEMRIVRAFNNGLITKDTEKQLWDELRRSRSDMADPFFSNPEFKSMTSGLRQAVTQDPDGKGYGPSAYKGAEAERVLRRKARIWKNDPKNQGRSFDEFMDAMEPISRDLMSTYNPEGGADLPKTPTGAPSVAPQSPPNRVPMPVEQAVKLLQQNPSPDARVLFEKTYPGLRAETYLRN